MASPNRKSPGYEPGPRGSALAIAENCDPRCKSGRASNQVLIASIRKGHAAELRVSLSTWRGKHKIELQECAATIPGMLWPTSAKVTVDLDHLPELIASLQAAGAEAIAKGMIARSEMTDARAITKAKGGQWCTD
jgi:hypothetical protein